MTQEQPPKPDSNDPATEASNTQGFEAPEPTVPDESLRVDSDQPTTEAFKAEDNPSLQSDISSSGDESSEDEFSLDWGEPSSQTTTANDEGSSAPPPQPLSTPASREVQSQTLRSLQQFWQNTQPTLKTGTIKTLKGTIRFLEAVVARLEAAPQSKESPTPPAPSTASTQPDGLANLASTLQQKWQQFWNWWKTVLPKIRLILPAAINENFSDQALTGAIAGLLVIVLWTTSSLFASKPPTQVAIAPPSKSTPAKTTTDKDIKEAPKAKQLPEVKVIPPPTATPKPQPSPSTQAPPQPTPSPTSELPKEAPKPEVTPTPKPTPSPAPPLKLTPEQKLIARIQDQVAEASDQSVSGLIQSVQANFRSSRLTVKVSSTWYTLSQTQQSKIANDVLQRAQQLNFVKLEIVDSQNTLLARSPVVGSEMVILKLASSEPSIARTINHPDYLS